MKSWSRAAALLKRGEGIVTHMYLDTQGNVTIGVGELVSTAAAAQELPLINRKTGKPATAEEIEAEFKTVQNLDEGFLPHRYRPHTSLDMPMDRINSRLEQRIRECEVDLFRMFERKWDLFPEDAQLGLLDMIYNLGRRRLETRFPKFMEAVRNEDWGKAAAECNRPDVSFERNLEVRGLFRTAEEYKTWEAERKKTAVVAGPGVTK